MVHSNCRHVFPVGIFGENISEDRKKKILEQIFVCLEGVFVLFENFPLFDKGEIWGFWEKVE